MNAMNVLYVLCEVDYESYPEKERTVIRIVKPLQVFESEDLANRACDLCMPFYNHSLKVIQSEQLHDEIWY